MYRVLAPYFIRAPAQKVPRMTRQPHTSTCNALVAEQLSDAVPSWFIDEVGIGLSRLWKTTGNDVLLDLATAFMYYMRDEGGACSSLIDPDDGQSVSEGPYDPELTMKRPGTEDTWDVYPLPLRRVSEATLGVWALYAQDPDLHPLLVSRLADLLWLRKHPPGRWHETAIKAFLMLAADPSTPALVRETAAVRAINLSQETNQRDSEQAACDALQGLVVSVLQTDPGNYGAVVRSLQKLAECGRDCDDLIDEAIVIHKHNPYWHAELCRIKRKDTATQPARRKCLQEALAVIVADADATPGLRQLVQLTDARKLALAENMPVEARELADKIARVNLDDDWVVTETTVSVPQERIDEALHAVVGDAATLDEALAAFGSHIPISPVEDNQTMARDLDAVSLQHLMRRVTVAEVGSQNAVTEDPTLGGYPDYQAEVGQLERAEIEWFALFVGVPFLKKIDELHNPTVNDLTACFRCAHIPEELAARVAKSYIHWRNSDFDSAVSVLVLTVEPVIRGLADARDVTLTKTKDTKSCNSEAVTLGGLLSRIAEHPAFLSDPLAPIYLKSVLRARADCSWLRAPAVPVVYEFDRDYQRYG